MAKTDEQRIENGTSMYLIWWVIRYSLDEIDLMTEL
jgi:hypothetical protein